MMEIASKLPDGWTRLVLVRHGASTQPGRVIGRLDPPLSDEGRAQAVRLATLLDGVPLDAVYASPRTRARDTALPLAQRRGLELIVRHELAEIDFGIFEGLTWDEASARNPVCWSMYMASPTEVHFPDGESWSLLRARVLDETRAIVRLHAGRTVAVVAHGGPLRVILADALGLSDRNAFRLEVSHGSVSIVELRDEALVRVVNRTP